MGKRYWRERAHTRASPRVVNNTHVTRPVAVLPCKKGYIVLNDSQLERLLFAPETTIYLCPTYYTYVYIVCVYGWRPRDDVPFNIIILHTRTYTHLPAVHIMLLFYMYIALRMSIIIIIIIITDDGGWRRLQRGDRLRSESSDGKNVRSSI